MRTNAFGALAVLAFVSACEDKGVPAPLPAVAAPLALEARERSLSDFEREGVFRLPAPIRPPTSEDGRVRIGTYLELPPPPAVLDVDAGGRWLVPLGSRLHRVESLAPVGTPVDAEPSSDWRILDVRSTTFTDAGEVFSVTRPKAGGRYLTLTWPGASQSEGTRALRALVVDGSIAGGGDDRAAFADKLVRINDCPSCHRVGRARDLSVAALVKRGTDARGLFSLGALFEDEGPFETYRAVDANRADPRVRARCGDRVVSDGRTSCGDGTMPLGELDVKGGLQDRAPHVVALCDARIRLAERMSPAARARAERGLTVCGTGVNHR